MKRSGRTSTWSSAARIALPFLLVLVAFCVGSGTAGAAEPPTCDGFALTIAGTTGNDVLSGTPGRDVIGGGNGDDLIDGAGGGDVICAGSGEDVVSGGEGADVVHGENGNDVLYGGDGPDRLDGGNGNDRVSGEDGNDTIVGLNGDDELAGGADVDGLDGGFGADTCSSGEHYVACENVTGPGNPLANVGPAGPGLVKVAAQNGVSVEIASNGGIYPWDVGVQMDTTLMRTVHDVLASPAYDFSLLRPAPAFDDAKITIPYDAAHLGAFPASKLRIYTFDEHLGLWISAGQNQVIDQVKHTVSVTVSHFSVYAVLKLDDEGWARYWASKPARCIPVGDPGDPGALALDLAFVIDESGSMGWNDPQGLRKTAAKEVVDRLAAISEFDRVGVVSFDSSARTRIGLTPLVTSFDVAAVKAAIDAIGVLGGTNIGAGVSRGISILTAGAPAGRPRAMVLMTDGVGSYDEALTAQAADEGIVIYTVGLGFDLDEALLRRIAAGTGGKYFSAPSAEDLVAAFDEIGHLIRDDGTDTDADGLTDCEETNGMLSTWGMYDTSLDPTQNDPFIGDRIVTSDPHDADTDDDGLTDGEEMRGLPMGDPLDLRDFEATRTEYAFLIEAGITKYYIMRSDPNDPETDNDGLLDKAELTGIKGADGQTYKTRADRWDTDLDGANDRVELELGTNPLFPDANELGIPGLSRFTLFQPYDPPPVVAGRWDFRPSPAQFIEYNRSPVTYFVPTFDCKSNCDAIRAAAEARDGGSWCWLPFHDCKSVEDRMRDVVREAVDKQAIFNEDGTFRQSFTQAEGVAECAQTHAVASECTDQAVLDAAPDSAQPGESLDSAIAEMLMNIPGGYRPKDLCGGESSRGGTYRLVDRATGQTRYVGQTGDFSVRRLQHANDPRFRDLDFKVQYRTDNYQVRRGLEQRDYNDLWGDVPYQQAQAKGSLNGQRPMDGARVDYDWRLDLAQQFLDLCL